MRAPIALLHVALYFSSQASFTDSILQITFLCAAQYIKISPVYYIGTGWDCMEVDGPLFDLHSTESLIQSIRQSFV